MQPTLSVLMTNYNHAHYIEEELDSILAQSYMPMEIIIIDDASTDNSLEILRDYARKYLQIRFLENKKNMGVLHNINRMLELSKSDYVIFASADDKTLPGFFEKSMGLLAQNPQAGLCSSLTRIINEESKDMGVLHMPIISRKSCFVSSDKVLPTLQENGSWIQGNTVILRRKALLESGGFSLDIESYADSFVYQVIAVKYGACYIPEPLTAWRKVKNSYSVTIAEDSELSLKLIRDVKKIMCSTYRDIFPSDFVNSWEKREVLNYRLNRLLDKKNDALEPLKEMLPSQGLCDRTVFNLVNSFTKIEYSLLKLYFYHRVGLPAGQLLVQRTKSLWRRIPTRGNNSK